MEIIVGKDTDNNVMQAGFAKSENRELGYQLSTDISSQDNIVYEYYNQYILTTGNTIKNFDPVPANYIYLMKMVNVRMITGASSYIRLYYYDLHDVIKYRELSPVTLYFPYTYTDNFILKTGMYYRIDINVSTQPCHIIVSLHYIKIPLS